MTKQQEQEARTAVRRSRAKPDDELVVMGKMRALLQSLPSDAARERVLSYLGHRTNHSLVAAPGGTKPSSVEAPARPPEFG